MLNKGKKITHVIPFEQLQKSDVQEVGGKNASLGEMIGNLTDVGISVPTGFAITAQAYQQFLQHNTLEPVIKPHLDGLASGALTLQETGSLIRNAILAGGFPHPWLDAVKKGYSDLCQKFNQPNLPVAVRSSATAEDLPEASFAGQQESFLNVCGESALLEACRRCYASLFTDRAITYREAQGFDHLQVSLSVGVQLMVDAGSGSAGVMFTLDTETGFPDAVVISASWGLGEAVVQGRVIADRYMVHKKLLDNPDVTPVFDKVRGSKAEKLVYCQQEQGGTQWLATSEEERAAVVLNDGEIIQLARWAAKVENHYRCPMDIEWAKDGTTGALFILQARPETAVSKRPKNVLTRYQLREKGELLLEGHSVGAAIACGKARVIKYPSEWGSFIDGEILVAKHTDPDWLPLMRRAAGVITDTGGTTSHAAIVCRELKIPAAVGTGNATELLSQHEAITLCCAQGATAGIYRGELAYEQTRVDVSSLPETRTNVMINMAIPDSAMQWWQLPIQGIGLARIEFIISSLIGIHPLALLETEKVKDPETLEKIKSLTRQYPDGASFFVDRMALGIAKLAASQYPKPVIVRFSDFKTNEYSKLLGGEIFESPESNPMLGLRGAARYYSERYKAGFGLECSAIKKVREHHGFDNIIPMIPFCRTPGEADNVLQVMAANGLERGKNGLNVYVMCEIPSNVVLADKFSERFDGFSIGSNDLTQLVLGVDRESAELEYLFDARDEAVKRMITQVINTAHHYGRGVGICGQAPSDHPDFAAFLVEQGIDSISLNPDSIVDALDSIAAAEAVTSKKSLGDN